MAEEYQKALLKHVEQIPWEPKFLESGVAHDKTQPNAAFGPLAGMTHAQLFADWDRGVGTTTCNTFLKACATAMGYTGGLPINSFDIAEALASRGLTHCWVLPDSGAEPECGDIFRLLAGVDQLDHNKLRKNHMGVVIEVNNGNWWTAEGGQGGKVSGQDKLMRKKYTGRPDYLRGWVSMRALLNANSSKSTNYWLGGWWKVEEESNDTWYYHFGANGSVAGSYYPPRTPLEPPIEAGFLGHFVESGYSKVEIRWNDESVDETIEVIKGGKAETTKSFVGKTRNGQKLKGTRIWNDYNKP